MTTLVSDLCIGILIRSSAAFAIKNDWQDIYSLMTVLLQIWDITIHTNHLDFTICGDYQPQWEEIS